MPALQESLDKAVDELGYFTAKLSTSKPFRAVRIALGKAGAHGFIADRDQQGYWQTPELLRQGSYFGTARSAAWIMPLSRAQ
jgi:hypothetical protein